MFPLGFLHGNALLICQHEDLEQARTSSTIVSIECAESLCVYKTHIDSVNSVVIRSVFLHHRSMKTLFVILTISSVPFSFGVCFENADMLTQLIRLERREEHRKEKPSSTLANTPASCV